MFTVHRALTKSIQIVENEKVIETERTCDICGNRITGTFYKLVKISAEIPRTRTCLDVCSECRQNMNTPSIYLALDSNNMSYSEIAIKKFLNPSKEIDSEYYSEYDTLFDDNTRYVEDEPIKNKTIDDSIDFIKKIAENAGIPVVSKKKGSYPWNS